MKLNLKMFKSNTAYWVIGAILLFGVFFYMASKGGWGASSSGDTTLATTPDPNALAMAQLNAQTQIAQGQISQQANSDTLNANTSVALAQLAAGVQVTEDQLGYNATLASIQAQQTMNAQNNTYSLDTAKVAADNNVDLATISRQAQADILNQQIALNGQNTGLLEYQLQTNQQMFNEQLRSSNISDLAATGSQIGTSSSRRIFLSDLTQLIGNTPTGGPAIVPVTQFPTVGNP